MLCVFFFVFFFKQKTAYEMRISDWSSDVCSSDLTTFRCSRCATAATRTGGCRASSTAATPTERPTRCSRRRCRSCPAKRSEEHTSELQSLMRISYAVFCLKKNKKIKKIHTNIKHAHKTPEYNTHKHKTNTIR